MINIRNAVMLLAQAITGKNLQMPGDPHYQPEALKPYLGYDQRVAWQILVEWFWLQHLASIGRMPREHGALLTDELLTKLLSEITTTEVTQVERNDTKHDILALLKLMKARMPQELQAWLHFGATSYDIISTAYALQLQFTFDVFYEKVGKVARIWRTKIDENLNTPQIFRTHLQHALPGTVGFWLSVLYTRFATSALRAHDLAPEVTGKFSGAVGTKAAMMALIGNDEETDFLRSMGIMPPSLSTQIAMPEPMARFYGELTLLSGALANFGEDVRHLQSSDIAEITSASSSSSTMAHKRGNPIAAENVAGMHISVRAEYQKVLDTLSSDLQRDLRGSNVMRGFGAIFVFTFQQLLTTERILTSLKVDEQRCRENLKQSMFLSMAELLHLSLQERGVSDSHSVVNKIIVPSAAESKLSLAQAMDQAVGNLKQEHPELSLAWDQVPIHIKDMIDNPERYIGTAVEMSRTALQQIL